MCVTGEDLVKRPVYLGIIFGEMRSLPVVLGNRMWKDFIF